MAEAIRNTLIWGVGNAFFGLAQFWVLTSGDILNIETYTNEDVIKEGIIMFFCTAIMGAVFLDYFLWKGSKNKFALVPITIFPFIAIAFVIYVYSLYHFKPGSNMDYNKIEEFQLVL